MARTAGAVLGTLLLAHAAAAQFIQQGNKLVGWNAVGTAEQGRSVAISADGNTAALGGWLDNSLSGAAWVFTRSAGAWSQQGGKLVGGGAAGAASQGSSVAISADGNTLIVGGFSDNNNLGASWVFTRSGGVWSPQGGKLVGTDAVGTAQQGISVAISGDGNTAIVGGWGDNSQVGAAWVFTRSGGAWSQQGGKLVGGGAVGAASQGSSVAISADGNTAIVCGWGDNSGVGATWVFTRSEGVWSQQGNKLVGGGAIGRSAQGTSVAISADGNTVMVGGWGDNSGLGAVWVFTRSAGVWSQKAGRLLGIGGYDPDNHVLFGSSVALSADGNTAIIGGDHDSSYIGAFWVYARSEGTWLPQGSKLIGTGAVGTARQGNSAAISANGSTAIVGGFFDNSSAGAAWVFVTNGCAAPWVTEQPQDQGLKNGQTATLSVTAIGTTPLSYQWYQGASGDTSHAVGTNASSFTTPALMATTSYWVRVSNACGHADSATATVSICTPPSITAQPQSQSIRSGQTATLSVTATGTTPLVYQWYQGASGDTSQAVGTNASSFSTPVLTTTTSYWVRVTNSCDYADSATATVSICTSPSITAQPQSQSIQSGQTAALSVAVTGTTPLVYQWYQGNAGDTSMPVGGDANTFTTSPLISAASFWVRVTNGCGTADSATATIAIGHGVRRHLHRSI